MSEQEWLKERVSEIHETVSRTEREVLQLVPLKEQIRTLEARFESRFADHESRIRSVEKIALMVLSIAALVQFVAPMLVKLWGK